MSSAPQHLSKPLKFLIVDDSRAIVAIIRRAITNCGYEPVEIQTAMNGEQALDMIEAFAPDLVITDWHMPKVSGLEMVQALRQMGHHKVRVGFVTTEKTPALLAEAINNGAMFILHKPFNDAELVEVVAAAVKDIAELALEKPAVQPKKADDPVPAAALQAHLQACLGNIPFRLIPQEKMVPEKLTPSNLLGLYSATARNGVYAIAVMDANAVCIVGGGSARKTPADVRAAMATGQPDVQMLIKAKEFLQSVANTLTESAQDPAVSVSLAKESLVKNTFAKLAEVLARPNNRSDFRLSIPGYGEGRMAFFVVAP
jgi:CheY-like chemotaxis protein